MFGSTGWHDPERRCLPILTVISMVVLCGAVPAPEGTEVTGAVGAGRYVYQGCGTYRITAPEAIVYGEFRHRIHPKITVSAEGTVAVGQIREVEGFEPSDKNPKEGDILLNAFSAARAGYEGEHGGLNLGMGLARIMDGRLASSTLIPSAIAWLGKPSVLYLWGRFASGPVASSGLFRYQSLGLGHHAKRYELELGFGIGFTATGGYRLTDELWLGGDFFTTYWPGAGDEANYQGILRLSYRPPVR